MKCCHFKMTGRGKWLPLLAAFKTRESRFIRNKQNLIFKRDVKMKPDFSPQSLFIALGKSGTLLFFLQCVSLPLFSFLLTLIWSPSNDQNLMEGLINSIVQRHFDICPKGVEALFFFFSRCHHVSPATCQKNKHAFAVKRCWKERKMFAWRKIEMWEEARGCKAGGTVRHLQGVWDIWIWRILRNTVWIGTFFC